MSALSLRRRKSPARKQIVPPARSGSVVVLPSPRVGSLEEVEAQLAKASAELGVARGQLAEVTGKLELLRRQVDAAGANVVGFGCDPDGSVRLTFTRASALTDYLAASMALRDGDDVPRVDVAARLSLVAPESSR